MKNIKLIHYQKHDFGDFWGNFDCYFEKNFYGWQHWILVECVAVLQQNRLRSGKIIAILKKEISLHKLNVRK